MGVWSKNSSSLAVSKKLKFFNGDEFIEGTGILRRFYDKTVYDHQVSQVKCWSEIMDGVVPKSKERAGERILAGLGVCREGNGGISRHL